MYIVCILQSQNNVYLTEIPESLTKRKERKEKSAQQF